MTPTTEPMAADLDGLEAKNAALVQLGRELANDLLVGHYAMGDAIEMIRALCDALGRRAVAGGGESAQAEIARLQSLLDDRTQALNTAEGEVFSARQERDAALRECSKWAREAGLAKGKLEASELAGVVDDWQARALSAEERVRVLSEALEKTDAAIKEWFRYLHGGEMRGSYDGKPERDGLRKAGYAATAALAAHQSKGQDDD